MDLQINQTFEAFEVYTKEHYQEMVCTAEKAHNISFLKKAYQHAHAPIWKKHVHHAAVPAVQLEDCAISPGFWVNPV